MVRSEIYRTVSMLFTDGGLCPAVQENFQNVINELNGHHYAMSGRFLESLPWPSFQNAVGIGKYSPKI